MAFDGCFVDGDREQGERRETDRQADRQTPRHADGQTDRQEKANKNGATPLLVASQHGHLEVVQFLCHAGADKEITLRRRPRNIVSMLIGGQDTLLWEIIESR